eukprot:3106407-Pyramimonas_sp.AAC.1
MARVTWKVRASPRRLRGAPVRRAHGLEGPPGGGRPEERGDWPMCGICPSRTRPIGRFVECSPQRIGAGGAGEKMERIE